MTRAEERAFAYQRELGMIDSVSDEHIVARRMGFYDGYRQAEKDRALTVEDIKTILDISFWNEDPEKILEEYNRLKK